MSFLKSRYCARCGRIKDDSEDDCECSVESPLKVAELKALQEDKEEQVSRLKSKMEALRREMYDKIEPLEKQLQKIRKPFEAKISAVNDELVAVSQESRWEIPKRIPGCAALH